MKSIIKISDDEVYLVAIANIQNNWRIYSKMKTEQILIPPIPTTFFWDESNGFKLVRDIKEGKGVLVNNNVLSIEIKCFYSHIMFKQLVRLLSTNEPEIKGGVLFIASNDYLPPLKTDLIFKLKNIF